jgi:ferric-dicitrate binding protein FerR (iron transport regulator)
VLFFVAGSWLIYSLYSKTGDTTLTADLQVREEILPDGSEITLNKNTVLTYSSKFGDEVRNLKLKKGEVFFKVKRDEAKPFVIQADDVEVRVLGTSFNVKHSDGQTEVIVETGVVRVKLGADSVELHKDQKVTISGGGKLRVAENTDQLYNYYVTKQLVADNTPLWRVVAALNEIYGAEISIEGDEIKNLPLNATFKEESLENILHVICDTFRLKMVRNGKQIILKQ